MKDRIAEWWGRRDSKKEDPIPFKEPDAAEESTPIVQEAPKTVEKIQETQEMTEKNTAIELKVVRPENYKEVATIADYLLDGCTVFLNMELLETNVMIRMLDFLRGVTYATEGQIKKSSATTYIITPNNVDISDEKKD